MKESLRNSIIKAKGQEKAQLVFKNARVVNVFTKEILELDVAVEEGYIVGLGKYSGEEEIDLGGKILSPGFIDSHVHIESSMSVPGQFAKAIMPRGVTSIITDPHEIANVKGIEGIKFMMEDSIKTPLDAYFVLPSCVPATPLENSGAILKAKDLEELIGEDMVIGLAEMMDYPGVINYNNDVLDKLILAKDMIVDGHGPMIKDKDLNAYVVAGVKTEHECSTKEEMIDRLRLGMYILIREGSATRDLKKLITGVNKGNLSRILFCTDDKHPEDLLNEGSIDYNIKLAIQAGIDPIDAITIASINPALAYGLKDKGAIAPGYEADLVVIDNFKDFNIQQVYKKGKLVAQNNKALFDSESILPKSLLDTVNIDENLTVEDLKLKIDGNKANVIKIIPDSIVTGRELRQVKTVDGYFQYGENRIQKIAVLERHKKTGNIGLGLIEGYDIKNGAVATTIGHDSHNLIVLGDNDHDMLLAINELKTIGGGITMVSNGNVIESLPLEIGGIMTEKTIEFINRNLKNMNRLAYDELKINKEIDPFMTLSFMALPVIPKLKMTDRGLFDVEKFEFIDIGE